MENIYAKILEVQKNNQKAVLCTVVETKGSAPLKPGAKMIIYEDNTSFGTVGGGSLENNTFEDAPKVFKTGRPQLFQYELPHKGGLGCGGSVKVFIEPIMKKKKLYVFGAGHVSKALVKIAAGLNFDITVIDGREDIFAAWDSSAAKLINKYHDEVLPDISFDEDTFIVIINYSHALDREIIIDSIQKPFAYIGMMGSHRKIEGFKKHLEKINIDKELIGRIDMPIGIDINAESAAEIAVSIAASLIEAKNGDSE